MSRDSTNRAIFFDENRTLRKSVTHRKVPVEDKFISTYFRYFVKPTSRIRQLFVPPPPPQIIPFSKGRYLTLREFF